MVLLNYTSKRFFVKPFGFRKEVYSSVQCTGISLYISGLFLMKKKLEDKDHYNQKYYYLSAE